MSGLLRGEIRNVVSHGVFLSLALRSLFLFSSFKKQRVISESFLAKVEQ